MELLFGTLFGEVCISASRTPHFGLLVEYLHCGYACHLSMTIKINEVGGTSRWKIRDDLVQVILHALLSV